MRAIIPILLCFMQFAVTQFTQSNWASIKLDYSYFSKPKSDCHLVAEGYVGESGERGGVAAVHPRLLEGPQRAH